MDYILSCDYEGTDKLANAFYDMENKYKNTAVLPLDKIEAIIEESGYGYVKDLLGKDEESTRLLVYLLVLVHQLKGSKDGIRIVLEILKNVGNQLVLHVVGHPNVSKGNVISGFSTKDYVFYDNFSPNQDEFSIKVKVKTGNILGAEQCIFSVNDHTVYLGITSYGNLVLSLGNDLKTWNIAERVINNSALEANKEYYIKLDYTGSSYVVRLSTDDKNYTDAIVVGGSDTNSVIEPLKAHKSKIYLGINNAEDALKSPFQGQVYISGFSGNVEDINIREWFEETPVAEENTFTINSSLNISILDTDFFNNFSEFLKRYVYPTLRAFSVKLVLETNITLLGYVREKVEYIAVSDLRTISYFQVKVPNSSPTDWEDMFVLDAREIRYDNFTVLEVDAD